MQARSVCMRPCHSIDSEMETISHEPAQDDETADLHFKNRRGLQHSATKILEIFYWKAFSQDQLDDLVLISIFNI